MGGECAMNCQEFDQLWNALLDAETAAHHRSARADDDARGDSTGREEAARLHAGSCPRCLELGVRNEALRRALRSWTRRPTASSTPELADRIVTAACHSSRTERRLQGAIAFAVAGLAVAASLFLVFGPIHWQLDHPKAERLARQSDGLQIGAAEQSPAMAADARLLKNALADATEATWDLARTTSGPAARLGRQVLEAAIRPEELASRSTTDDAEDRSESALTALPALLRDLPGSPPGAGLLQDVGVGLTESFRPVSATARQAFGFLRSPSLDKIGSPVASPASKGA